jgi:hypothetical protein
MRKFLMRVGALLLMGALGSGCTYVTAVRSIQGKAFIIKRSPTGDSFWNCDASTGEPICFRVVEVPAK